MTPHHDHRRQRSVTGHVGERASLCAAACTPSAAATAACLGLLLAFHAPVTAKSYCATNGITPGPVTKKVCASTPDVCEVYIKKGNENGVSNIKTCRQFCNAYGMDCTAQYEDKKNGCVRDYKYGSCDAVGGTTTDHICQCGKASKPPPSPPTLGATFQFGKVDSNECPLGATPFADLATCQAAYTPGAAAAKFTFVSFGKTLSSATAPKGCYLDVILTPMIIFNTHATGSETPGSGCKPICNPLGNNADAPTTTGGGLCATNGITTGPVTKKVCARAPDVCEVYIKKGNENGVSNIKTCRQFCNAYDMDCTAQYEDKKNGCVRKYKYGSCDVEDKTSDHICQCGKASTTTTSTATTPTTTDAPTTTNSDKQLILALLAKVEVLEEQVKNNDCTAPAGCDTRPVLDETWCKGAIIENICKCP